MEDNIFWFQNLDQHSLNWNSMNAQINTGQPHTIPAYMKTYSNEVSPNGSLPSCAFPALAHSRSIRPNETSNWFYCLPRFRQAIAPISNSMPIEKLPAGTAEKIGGQGKTTFGTDRAQKQFLVFDQSGDQTTLVYRSKIGSPVPCLNSWNLRLPASHNWLKDEPAINKDAISLLGPYVKEEHDEGNQKDDTESDMREDTEELNALLYSDDEYEYSEDEEETSTGHSPSTMTAHMIQDRFEAKGEQVASSAGSTKRQKLLDGGYDTPSAVLDTAVMDTASSLKCAAGSELEDDAESSCGNAGNQVSRGFSSFSGKKRSRKESIRETIRVLQKVIPDGEGKDTMVIIDEAINYLKSLKAKAKDLGLDTV